MASCPICEKESKGRDENPSFPFCSPRCKMVDLGKWLKEEYRVAGEPEDDVADDDDDAPPKGDVRH